MFKQTICMSMAFLLSVVSSYALAQECQPNISRGELLKIENALEVCYEGKKVIFAVGKSFIDKKLLKRNPDDAKSFAMEEAVMLARQNLADFISGGGIMRSTSSENVDIGNNGKSTHTKKTEITTTTAAKFPAKIIKYILHQDNAQIVVGMSVAAPSQDVQ